MKRAIPAGEFCGLHVTTNGNLLTCHYKSREVHPTLTSHKPDFERGEGKIQHIRTSQDWSEGTLSSRSTYF